MRIIDKTPLVEEDSSLSFINRIKGTVQYGFSWYPNLQAQQKAISILDKKLNKKFTLIRNQTLGKSKITIPFILIGPPGVQVIFVTHLDGSYQAKNDTWGTLANGVFKAANINLLKRTAQFSKAMQVYLERQNFELPNGVEPILLSVNPALHVASVRPIVRIVMSDAADRFASSLAQEPPRMSVEVVHQMADAIISPRKPKSQEASPVSQPEVEPEVTFQESEPEQSFSPGAMIEDIGFAFEDEEPAQAPPPAPKPQTRKTTRPPAKKATSGYFGMTQKQFTIIGVMAAILVCFLVAFIMGTLWWISQ